MRKAFAAACLIALGASCSARKPVVTGVYQLRGDLVVPPAGGTPELKAARKSRRKGCDLAGDALALSWKGRTATLRTSGLELDQAGRMPLDQLKTINQFRDALKRLESNGCLRPGEASALLTRLTQEVALPSATAYELAHASHPVQGYVDIEHPFRLKLVSVLRADGRVTGFETARYAVRLGTLTPAGPEGKVARLSVPAGTKYLRLFFLTRRSSADHDAILVAAPNLTILTEATAAIQSEGEQYCRDRRQICVSAPREVGLSAELPIGANGTIIGVPVRGRVSDALKEAGVRDPAPLVKTLRVTRPYKGKPIPIQFDASRRDILNLVLIGGEELSWQ